MLEGNRWVSLKREVKMLRVWGFVADIFSDILEP